MIYTLDTIFDLNIITLAQVVHEIFCSQASIGLQCNENEKKNEKGNISNRKAMNRNRSNQKANPALKTNAGNK